MEQPKKTDESVKAGLQLEGDTKPQHHEEKKIPVPDETGKEKDPDDLVHEQAEVTANMETEQDADELVHSITPTTPDTIMEERDPDDLVHENTRPADEDQY